MNKSYKTSKRRLNTLKVVSNTLSMDLNHLIALPQ